MISPPVPRRAEVHEARPAFGHGPKSRVRGLGEIIGEMPTAALNDEILLEGDGQVKTKKGLTVGRNKTAGGLTEDDGEVLK